MTLLLQVELVELRSLVESLSRKNRYLTEELNEAHRTQESTHTQLLGLQVCEALRRGPGLLQQGPAAQ